MLKTIVSAAAITIMAASASWAASPAAPATSTAARHLDTNLVEVQRKKRSVKRRNVRRPRANARRFNNRQRYRTGYRYRTAPAGWRRYSARPYDWRTRGCVIVGPIWFCP